MRRGTQTLALGAAAVALAVAGCGSTSTGANVNSAASPPTSTTTTQATPAPPQTFNGNGTENLGTLHVPTDSLLTWSYNCSTEPGICVFSIGSDVNSNGNVIAVDSQASSGRSEVTADTYTNVEVEAYGSWTITIAANG